MKTHTAKLVMTLLFCCLLIISEAGSPPNQTIDIISYDFQLTLNDSVQFIDAEAVIRILFVQSSRDIYLHLDGPNDDGTGMQVLEVFEEGKRIDFKQSEDQLILKTDETSKSKLRTYSISYRGRPKDGLLFKENKFGEKTIFTSHWPNKARYWMPCIDDPTDKAKVSFRIKAPAHYTVIANGTFRSASNLQNGLRESIYEMQVPIPTKVMAFVCGDFAIDTAGIIDDIPITSWSYTADRNAGSIDFSAGANILEYFIWKIGEYPFSKLSNVQTPTEFGGMENAGNIFYNERLVTGNNELDEIMAHEIAHQWFGNSVTESDFSHLWLSEGFANYLEVVFVEENKGAAISRSKLTDYRNLILEAGLDGARPVVDPDYEEHMNTYYLNAYCKGPWVLHMLRCKLGDQLFWEIIRAFYRKYQFKNISTQDFIAFANTFVKIDLKPFFEQWLKKPGYPKLNINWAKTKSHEFVVTVGQLQEGTPYTFPLELRVFFSDGTANLFTIDIKDKNTAAAFEMENVEIVKILPDPRTRLLFEEVSF